MIDSKNIRLTSGPPRSSDDVSRFDTSIRIYQAGAISLPFRVISFHMNPHKRYQ
jgi:hypothetical protein